MAQQKQLGFFGLFIMGVIFAAAGLAIVYYFGKDIKLNCVRTENQCIIEKTNVFGEKTIDETFALNSLQGAEVIEKRDSDGDYTYKVMLKTTEGSIPLSSISTSDRSGQNKDARKINAFINSMDENFELIQSGKFIKIFGFVFAGIGGLMLLGSLGGVLKLIVLGLVLLSKR